MSGIHIKRNLEDLEHVLSPPETSWIFWWKNQEKSYGKTQPNWKNAKNSTFQNSKLWPQIISQNESIPVLSTKVNMLEKLLPTFSHIYMHTSGTYRKFFKLSKFSKKSTFSLCWSYVVPHVCNKKHFWDFFGLISYLSPN